MLFRPVTIFVGVQLCNYKYTAFSLNSPCFQCSHIRTCFQCIPFASMKNMDFSEGDFALLLLAEKQAAISKKNWRTNKRTSKHTNVTQIKLFPSFYDYHSVDQSLNRSVKISINRSIAIDQSLDRSIERTITQSINNPIGLDRSLELSISLYLDQLINQSIIDQSVYRSTERSIAIEQSVDRSINQSILCSIISSRADTDVSSVSKF